MSGKTNQVSECLIVVISTMTSLLIHSNADYVKLVQFRIMYGYEVIFFTTCFDVIDIGILFQ